MFDPSFMLTSVAATLMSSNSLLNWLAVGAGTTEAVLIIIIIIIIIITDNEAYS